jgi:hypothetical protein
VDGGQNVRSEGDCERLRKNEEYLESHSSGIWEADRPLCWSERVPAGGGDLGGGPRLLHPEGVQPGGGRAGVPDLREEERGEGGGSQTQPAQEDKAGPDEKQASLGHGQLGGGGKDRWVVLQWEMDG